MTWMVMKMQLVALPESLQIQITQLKEGISSQAIHYSQSKEKPELLAWKLKENNLLEENFRVSYHQKLNFNLITFFKVDGLLCYCHAINGLFTTHVASDWHLFIDSSQRSLKTVILHNGNVIPSFPIAYSVHQKETW